MPEDNEIKPSDVKSIKYRTVQLENLMKQVWKLKNFIEQDDANAFTKAGKLKTGQECAQKLMRKVLELFQA